MKILLAGLLFFLPLKTALVYADTERDTSITSITRSLDRNQTRGIEPLINRHLQLYPDDSAAYGQLSRLIMKTGAINDNGFLGYRFTEEADKKAVAALDKALKLDPQNPTEQSRLGYLHAVQGRYKQAEKVFATISTDIEPPLWLGYNKAIAAIGVGDNNLAATLLDPTTRQRPSDLNYSQAWVAYRSAWSLRKTLALKDSTTDPVVAVREGKMRRVAIHNLYEEALSSGKDKPILVFLSSGDSACPPCVKDAEDLSKVADALGDQYELIYASVEPWNDIEKEKDLLRAFKIRGLPSHFIMYKGKYLVGKGGAFPLSEVAKYREVAPGIISGKYKGKKVE